MSPTSIVAYLILFAGVGFLFLFTSLLIGRLLRPRSPSPEKSDVYECGEPTIGSSYVQFDLRFYVVALVFLIFAVLVMANLHYQIVQEEEFLTEVHGPAYEAYRAKTARYFTLRREASAMRDLDPQREL